MRNKLSLIYSSLLPYIYNKVRKGKTRDKVTADLKSAVAFSCTLGSLVPMIIPFLLSSCGAENTISRKFACQFTFQTQNHAGNTLEIALNGYGTYTFVSASYKNGVWHILSTPNDGSGKTEDIAITAANEKQYTNPTNLGANNGIIIGQTNFNGIVAYDRQCPNCINQYGGTNYPLAWNPTNRQLVTCAKCHRTYDLEYGNIKDGASGDRLMQYLISYNSNTYGTGKVIWVHN